MMHSHQIERERAQPSITKSKRKDDNMRKTRRMETNNAVTVDTKTLQAMLGCGRDCAVKLGEAANAKVRCGRRVLWSVDKVKLYIAEMTD